MKMSRGTLAVTIIILVVIIIIGAVLLSPKKNRGPRSAASDNVTLCYAYNQANAQGFLDNASVKLVIKGDQVSGEYQSLPAEKDAKTGTFTGTVTAIDPVNQSRTAKVLWASFAEGIKVTEQLFITFSDTRATAFYGEMVNRGDGTYVYKDQASLTPGFEMTPVDCKKL